MSQSQNQPWDSSQETIKISGTAGMQIHCALLSDSFQFISNGEQDKQNEDFNTASHFNW